MLEGHCEVENVTPIKRSNVDINIFPVKQSPLVASLLNQLLRVQNV